MEPLPLLYISTTTLCLGSGALASWAREALSHAHRNQPESLIPSSSAQKAIDLWKDRSTPLALGLTRFISGSIALLILNHSWSRPSFTGMILGNALIIALLYMLMGLIPQTLAKCAPYRGLTIASVFSRLCLWIYTPWIAIHLWLQSFLVSRFGQDPRLNFLTDEELARIASEEEGKTVHPESLDAEERQMIRNIFDWSETPASEVMTPRGDMICLDIGSTIEEAVQFLNMERLSRVPVYDENLDNILGVLHAKDFFHWYSSHRHEHSDLRRLLRPALCINRNTSLSDLMTEFKRTKTHLAILIDDYGGTLGLVTLEDLIEEIVGEIYDEDDELESLVREVRPRTFIADPGITLDDLAHAIQFPLDVEEELAIDTLGGLIQWKLGALPRKGAVMDHQGLRIKILKIEETRIASVLLEISPV